MKRSVWIWLVACTPTERPGLVQEGGAVEDVPAPRAAVEVEDPAAGVPELPQVWSVPSMEHSLVAVDDGAGIVGRVSGYPETIARVDSRTGKELWRLAQPDGVMWTEIRAGRGYGVVAGRLPMRGGERIGVVNLGDGSLQWHRGVAERVMPVIGREGSGVGYVEGCGLEVLDPATGRPWGALEGRTAMVGHAGPAGPQMHALCTTMPVLLGMTEPCVMALTPRATADMVLTTLGANGTCWELALGRVDSQPTFATGYDVMAWHAEATLQVLEFDRETGGVRWRREFAGPGCDPTARLVGGTTLVLACGEAWMLGFGGRALWTIEGVDADAVAVVGEDSEGLLLNDSPGVRHVQYVTEHGALAGRIEVPDGASARAIGAGLVIETRETSTLWDPQGVRRWVYRGSGLSPRVGQYAVITGSGVVLDLRTGQALGRDPFGATPLAVLPAEGEGPALMVMRAGYLWARALP